MLRIFSWGLGIVAWLTPILMTSYEIISRELGYSTIFPQSIDDFYWSLSIGATYFFIGAILSFIASILAIIAYRQQYQDNILNHVFRLLEFILISLPFVSFLFFSWVVFYK